MFGTSGFSAVSFASAPGFLYGVSVVESLSIVDLDTTTANFISFVNSQCNGLDIAESLSVLNASTIEVVSSVDATASSYVINTQVLESNSASDILSITLTFDASVYEVSTAADVRLTQLDFVCAVLDYAEVTDSVVSLSVFVTNVTNSAQTNDLYTSGGVFVASTVGIANAVELFGGSVDFGCTIGETVLGFDQEFVNTNFSVDVVNTAMAVCEVDSSISVLSRIQESVEAVDALLSRYLWETINTQEQQTWSVIKTDNVKIAATVGGGFASGEFSSGPFSGLGGAIRIIPLKDEWNIEDTSQGSEWNLVRTVD